MWSSPVQPPWCWARQLISNELAYFQTKTTYFMGLTKLTNMTFVCIFLGSKFIKLLGQKTTKKSIAFHWYHYLIHNQRIWQHTGGRTEENSRSYYALNYKMRFNQLRNQTCSAGGLNRQEWTEIMCNRRELAFEDIT